MFIECYHKIHKDQKVQGFLNYDYCAELEEVAQYNVYEVLENNQVINTNYTGENEIDYLCIYVHGSRVFGNPRKNSDIDFVLFYKGSIREDDLFNIFADENIFIEHAKCDFNPIQIDDDSDIEYYIQKHDVEYHQKPILEKKINLALALDDFDDEEQVQNIKSKQIIHGDYTKDYLDLMKEVVDLGLPSGTLWCKYNLDVNPNQLTKAEDWYGGYYAWGEIEPKPKNISKTNWTNYKFCKELDQQNRPIFTKYITKHKDAHGCAIIYTDNLTHLLPEDDAAYQNKHIGNYKFCIPIVAQLEELIDNLESEWVNNYNNIKGLNGTIFKGENGNEIFFPYAGIITDTKKEWVGSTAFILSNEIAALNLQPICMEMFGNQFGVTNDIVNRSIHRYEAFSIRPVLQKSN